MLNFGHAKITEDLGDVLIEQIAVDFDFYDQLFPYEKIRKIFAESGPIFVEDT